MECNPEEHNYKIVYITESEVKKMAEYCNIKNPPPDSIVVVSECRKCGMLNKFLTRRSQLD